MSVLLLKIRRTNQSAAKVLEDADVRTDLDIQSLTREELTELFPGSKNFKLRRSIFKIIHEQKPTDELISELKAFIPLESFRAALTSNGVLADYLRILKDMKTQMNNVQGFLDAHIGLLEELSTDQPDQEPNKGSFPSTSTSPITQTGGCSYGPQDSTGTSAAGGLYSSPTLGLPPTPPATVTYRTVVSGRTLGAHAQLMEKVLEDQVCDQVQFVNNSLDHQINIVFCPISSRIGADVDAAMSDVKDDKPVILVVMNYSREPKYISPVRTWSHDPKVVLCVNAFYHETRNGLLICQENNVAVSDIRKKLLEYKTPTHEDNVMLGNAQGVVTESGRTGNTPVRHGSKNKASESGSSLYKYVFGHK
ncbi:uncharacterized protein LOC127368118 [Dicentrarchus labrax]|uniref:uncharacterized protein LOC127368118 n=1 Tax=Dicentrarchus labrax TaxID=13489 RepID=UPI0021F53763|nr:uncharacterized protein LOC127368118 [Dicentrarchus labrax]